tara:strand:- start:339 stop:506 length:168 start_codon:yes stop_codon:yes gene_type:complete
MTPDKEKLKEYAVDLQSGTVFAFSLDEARRKASALITEGVITARLDDCVLVGDAE